MSAPSQREPSREEKASIPSPDRRPASEGFRHFAAAASHLLGTPRAFFAAIAMVLVWAASGPFFDFGERWQLIINTCTTIITFLMVFIIQTTQNRDARAIHLKLDELIRSSKARNIFADLEDATDAELDAFQLEFATLRKKGADVDDAARTAHIRARGHEPESEREVPADGEGVPNGR